jgi:hypothetical protein
MIIMSEDEDWLFGKAIRRARGPRSVRGLAPLANISEARWRQLENGYTSAAKGMRIPARPKASTAAAMAAAVGLTEDEGLRLAGFTREDLADEDAALIPTRGSDLTNQELLDEVARRMGIEAVALTPPADLTLRRREGETRDDSMRRQGAARRRPAEGSAPGTSPGTPE